MSNVIAGGPEHEGAGWPDDPQVDAIKSLLQSRGWGRLTKVRDPNIDPQIERFLYKKGPIKVPKSETPMGVGLSELHSWAVHAATLRILLWPGRVMTSHMHHRSYANASALLRAPRAPSAQLSGSDTSHDMS